MAGTSRYLLRSLSGGGTKMSCRLSSTEIQNLKVIHDKKNMEFYIKLGNDKAFLQYDIIDPKTGSVDLQHTVVPDAYQGQGIAKVLAKNVLDHFAGRDQHMKLTCWYLKKYYKENSLPIYNGKIIQ